MLSRSSLGRLEHLESNRVFIIEVHEFRSVYLVTCSCIASCPGLSVQK
jgi:hypothetical protein